MEDKSIVSISAFQKEVFFQEKWRFEVAFDNGEKHNVIVTADVERNEAFEDKDGTTAFIVNLYYYIDNYMLQEHVIGLFFGSKDMKPDEIEKTAHSIALEYVSNSFWDEEELPFYIDEYLKKMDYLEREQTEDIIEAWANSCDSDAHEDCDCDNHAEW